MVYAVVLADSAKADADRIFAWVLERAPIRGPEWFEDLMGSLGSPEKQPYRCPLAREARKSRRKIRCLLFGKRRNAFRILYEVDDQRQIVYVLHIRRGTRRDLKPAELKHTNDSQ